MKRLILLALMMLLAIPASAIEFSRLFAAAPGGIEGNQFPADTATVYIRYAYQDARPGQTLTSYWIIQQSEESEAGQFSHSKVTLEKAADLGQFSFSPEQGWPTGQYQVLLTDDNDEIVGEVLFRIGGDPDASDTSAANPTSVPNPATPDSSAIQDESENSSSILFELVNPAPVAEVPELVIAQLSLSGPDIKGKPGKASKRFDTDTPVVNLRFEYQQAQPGELIQAFWRHRTSGKKQAGIGLFAQSQLQLQHPEGKAHFAFHPQQKAWLPGRYEVELVARNKTLATAGFDLATPPRKIVMLKKKAPKPVKKKVTTRSPRVLEAVLARSIENARPKEPTTEFTNVWRRLFVWARIDGGNRNTIITSRWYTGETGGELQATHRQSITPGENWVVFWLHLKNHEAMLPVGPARVELNWGKKHLKTLHYNVKQAGFFDGLGDSFKQMGSEVQWLIDQNLDE